MPCPPPGDLPNPGIKPRSPELQADSLSSEPPGKPTWDHPLAGILVSFGYNSVSCLSQFPPIALVMQFITLSSGGAPLPLAQTDPCAPVTRICAVQSPEDVQLPRECFPGSGHICKCCLSKKAAFILTEPRNKESAPLTIPQYTRVSAAGSISKQALSYHPTALILPEI